MSDITLSKAVRSNLLNLQSTASLLGKSQERLSSGLRVNSALDNPTNFFTAQGLNSRANDLSQLSDAVSNAVQTVAAADKGITAITKLVESAQATARQALQTAETVSETTITAQASHNGSADVPASHAGGALTVNGVSITIAANDDASDIKAALEGATGFGTANFTVTDNAGTLEFDGTNGASLVISGAGAANVNVTAGTYAATSTTANVANPKREELVATYNDLLGQIDALAKDSGFNGVNLLNGDDLSVLFNEDGTSKLEITGVTNDAETLGLDALDDDGFDTNVAINATLDDLKGAIEELRSQSAKFGANLSVVETRQEFTKNMISVLQTGAANLTLADTNEEAANVLALQTRQQLSSTALSLASQADQNVLRLF